jgi:hypothetical protein
MNTATPARTHLHTPTGLMGTRAHNLHTPTHPHPPTPNNPHTRTPTRTRSTRACTSSWDAAAKNTRVSKGSRGSTVTGPACSEEAWGRGGAGKGSSAWRGSTPAILLALEIPTPSNIVMYSEGPGKEIGLPGLRPGAGRGGGGKRHTAIRHKVVGQCTALTQGVPWRRSDRSDTSCAARVATATQCTGICRLQHLCNWGCRSPVHGLRPQRRHQATHPVTMTGQPAKPGPSSPPRPSP